MDNQEHEDDYDKASISSAEEGLMDLLGGLSSQIMIGATEEEIVIMDGDKTSAELEKKQTPIQTARLYQDNKNFNNACRKDMFSRAFHLTKDGQLQSPPVMIVDLSTEGKGNILVASRNIFKGEVIFSERSLEAAQVPSHAYDPRISANMSKLNGIRACQHCFKSMEPASGFKCEEGNMELPMKHFWPIEEWEEEGTSIKHESYDHILIDTHTGRMKCLECQALFCNKYCMQAHFQIMGSCCNCTKSMEAFINVMYQDKEGEREHILIEPVLLLATRMFCAMVNSERNCKGSSGQLYQGFCGEASDCQPLRLGREKDGKFSLQSGYEEITKILQMNEAECRIHHLHEFEKVVAISQRNAISVTTASPFKTYYSAILRNFGRGTERQKEAMSQVAKLLGNPEGILTRDMDRIVEEKVAVKIGGLFSLTAMMNHCCDPCAEIRSQEYVDCNVDVVAKRDVKAGEEITNSYINLGSSPSNSIKFDFFCRKATKLGGTAMNNEKFNGIIARFKYNIRNEYLYAACQDAELLKNEDKTNRDHITFYNALILGLQGELQSCIRCLRNIQNSLLKHPVSVASLYFLSNEIEEEKLEKLRIEAKASFDFVTLEGVLLAIDFHLLCIKIYTKLQNFWRK